jgi:CRP-like cAMP-binding protein
MRSVTLNAGLEKLTTRLGDFCSLSTDERLALAGTLGAERAFGPREELVPDGRAVDGLHLVIEGFAGRTKLLPDGRRQILGLLLPGDLCDLRLLVLGRLDHAVTALSAVRASFIPLGAAATLMERHPRVGRALWWRAAVEDAITHEWLVNAGYRTAHERVAHLLCEVFWRLESVGLVQDNQCRFPLTQTELGDAVALSAVHINRTLMGMRRAGLVRLHGGRLELLDREALQKAGGFDPAYLHLQARAPAQLIGDDEALPGQSIRVSTGLAPNA